MNPIIAILPRILIGIGSYYIYRLVKIKATNIRIGIASIMGSFINTIGVLGISYLLYGNKLAEVMGISKTAVGITFLTTAGTNGVAEAAISALITIPVVGALRKILK